MKFINVSIVICARNSETIVLDTLKKIRDTKFEKPWEVVVVDRHKENREKKLLGLFKKSSGYPYVSYYSVPKKSLSQAKNYGWVKSKGEYITFLNDDCYPETNFLELVSGIFEDNPVFGFLGGRVFTEAGTYENESGSQPEKPMLFEYSNIVEVDTIQTAHLSVRRKSIKDVRGFDPLLDPKKHLPSNVADYDLINRILFTGWRGCFHPDIISIQHGENLMLVLPGSGARTFESRGAYFAKLFLDKRSRSQVSSLYLKQIKNQNFKNQTLAELIGAIKYLSNRYVAVPVLQLRRKFKITY